MEVSDHMPDIPIYVENLAEIIFQFNTFSDTLPTTDPALTPCKMLSNRVIERDSVPIDLICKDSIIIN